MNSFISSEDTALTEQFLREGYIVAPAEDAFALSKLRQLAISAFPWPSLDEIHHQLRPVELNTLKLSLMGIFNETPWTRELYFSLAQDLLYALIGNELAMQKKFNLNIQLPGDTENLLPIHADTWTGDSAYQLVLWVPLTDCYGTKSMFILPPGEPYTLQESAEATFRSIETKVKYLEIKYGEVLLFNPTLPHGNRVNRESTSRWTLNCRFKSVHSPYGVKGPGEHFEPITLRAASIIGMAYKQP